MHRCTSCNKRFDYEKNYGMCPKCGAYNQNPNRKSYIDDLGRYGKNIKDYELKSEQSSREALERAMGMHKGFGVDRDFKKHQSSKIHKQFPGLHDRLNKQQSQKHAQKNFGSGQKVSFKLTIVLVVLAILAVFAATKTDEIVKTVDMGVGLFIDRYNMDGNNNLPIDIYYMNEDEEFIANGGHLIEVSEAKVLFEADTVEEFPAGQKCIGVYVSAELYDEDSNHRYFEDPYIKVNNQFKEPIPQSSLEEMEEFTDIPLAGRYSFAYGDVEGGYFVFFVDKDVNTFTMCFNDYSSEVEDKITTVYEIDLKLE